MPAGPGGSSNHCATPLRPNRPKVSRRPLAVARLNAALIRLLATGNLIAR